MGDVFQVSCEPHGQFVCRGRRTYNCGIDVWFKTPKGWSWSGGTVNARWRGGWVEIAHGVRKADRNGWADMTPIRKTSRSQATRCHGISPA